MSETLALAEVQVLLFCLFPTLILVVRHVCAWRPVARRHAHSCKISSMQCLKFVPIQGHAMAPLIILLQEVRLLLKSGLESPYTKEHPNLRDQLDQVDKESSVKERNRYGCVCTCILDS